MATESIGETPTLFLRKATGLVRGWSVRDSIIYACLATNFVTLGIYEFTFAGPAFPTGQLITSIVISGVWVSFLVIAYAGLIVTIPRAGGDYVWQTRILGSGLGFVMAATGWWFILWLWAPIYGNILAVQLFEPLWATLKWTWPNGGALWFGTSHRDLRGHGHHDRHGGPPRLARHGGLRADPELVPSTAAWSASGHRRAAAGQQPRQLRQLVQPGDAQAVRRQQRLPRHQRGRGQGRVRRAQARLRPARPDHAAGARDDVLPPVAELGRHAVRRDPRGERLQARVHRHVHRAVDHRRCCPSPSCCWRPRPSAGPSTRTPTRPTTTPWSTRRRCRSGPTRCCSPAGWSTTPRSRSS